MGVKSKAAVAILVLLLFLGSLWLQGGLDYQWNACLKGYNQENKVGALANYKTGHHMLHFLYRAQSLKQMANLKVANHFRVLSFFVPLSMPPHPPPPPPLTHLPSPFRQLHHLYNSSGVDGAEGPQVLEGCPGQTFQVSLLLTHLLAAPAYQSDVLLQPYLSSWDELVKFMEALGPMVGLISKEIETKTSIIRQLALLSEKNSEAELGPDGSSVNTGAGTENDPEASRHAGPYHSLRSMIWMEMKQGLVDFQHQTDSGCRTILRLHRALLWLKLFLQKLAETPVAGRLRSPSELCRESYQNTLSNHHTWFVRRAAELAFIALPERGFFYRLVCVQGQEDLSILLNKVVEAIGEVYNRTQKALEENGMLDLP